MVVFYNVTSNKLLLAKHTIEGRRVPIRMGGDMFHLMPPFPEERPHFHDRLQVVT